MINIIMKFIKWCAIVFFISYADYKSENDLFLMFIPVDEAEWDVELGFISV